MLTPFPTQSNVAAALRSFLLAVLPAGTPIIIAQQNRIPEPQPSNFLLMTPIRMTRLRTNIDTRADVKFTGSITTNILTVSAVAYGVIAAGATVFGVGVASGTQIIAQTGGTPGGIGTYSVTGTQTIGGETLASGAMNVEAGTEVVMQLDFHGADPYSAGDMATTVSTLFRDVFAVDQFAGQSPNYGVVPLLADDPRQMVFLDAEQQFESRWIVDARLQANFVCAVPQTFFDTVTLTVIDVDATYPPT